MMDKGMPTYEEKIIEQFNTEILEAEERLSQLSFDPNYDGIIVYQYIKCGKKGCRCTLEHDRRVLHGPYPHFQYRDKKNGNKLHQKYLNRKNVREYREKVEANNEYKKAKKELNRLKREKAKYIKEISAKKNKEGKE